MKYLKHSWSQTSQNKHNTNYLFLRKEIIVDSNKKLSIEYYKNIIKEVTLLSEKGIKTIIVLPDVYLNFFRNLYRVSNDALDEYSYKNLKYKLENLKLFCKTVISLENVTIFSKLSFENIISISKIINKGKDLSNEINANNDYVYQSKTNVMDYNDLIYTQEIDLSSVKENKKQLNLVENLNAIYNELISLFYVSGLVFENLFYTLEKKSKHDLLNSKKILYDNLLLFKKKNNLKISLYLDSIAVKKNFIDNEIFDEVFLESKINKEFLKSFYSIDKYVKMKYIPVYDFDYFLETQSYEKVFKLEQILSLIQKMFFVPKNIAFYPLHKLENEENSNIIEMLNYDTIINNFIFELILKRSFDFGFLISKKIVLNLYKNLFLQKTIYRMKLIVDDQKIEVFFNLTNKSVKLNKNKILNPFEVKIL
ncbi:hypothetical protein [Mycoplasma sp. OR1901]|uniref:hypothetical protein n=1 Tax=Mycoplasma sp. OR1901 TaxID=2742195 RepID=UPI0015835097|nr:hypothetical protein [Mycoplasma sp. OR1901]QKT05297.1 hypothetical protein HTZ87_01090 [Mycoplasma sp. OR1901]